ncbi:LolA family protein [Calidifontibacillus erzurumensis]|uniref:Outer membrane lipoprotein carrier protein LolA n=1 Tax=Calidifontibacillus erzurumensis TaxID=2741433 RepID=A0A8J8GFE2_9BACI|nr:outer membrane lipoprotein carrier protein LolA [Calidifontibacillus erzurumensis]NSL52469.1 outer membrane lipoprotein carrier protein LolA [Calidifontibacillus erzurumensis]
MRKSFALLIVGLVLVMGLVGCGSKSQEDVKEALNKKMEEITGYKANATLTLQTGNEPQDYSIDIWHNKPDFYRVHLKSDNKEQSQMILRNKEGVFVITPALNKSFRFQSDWPENSSQAYLYESLVKDILDDDKSKFSQTDTTYVFETKTNYQNNKTLPIQEITINKKDLSPVMVKVMDQDRQPLVQVEFNGFEFDSKFDKDAFDLEKNKTSAELDTPTMAQPADAKLTVLYPEYTPGMELIEEKRVKTDSGERIVLTYAGEKSFTLFEEVSTVLPASAPVFVDGEPVDLGFTVGVLTENALSWSYGGVDFYLASQDLSQEEMYEIARSVQGQAIK